MGSGAGDDQTLTLELGLSSSLKSNPASSSSNLIIKAAQVKVKQPPWDQAEPSLTLSLELSGDTYPMPHQELSATSSHSNSLAVPPNFVSVKREREAYTASDEEEEEEDGSPTATAATATATRKKLRLTKEQSALLEDSFKQHSTLNPKQKQALADRLNLRPRQVEVWFQNRRARTKLKQTEMDCEQLKKCCETLSDENRRLHKELQELRALKLGQPNGSMYMHMAASAPAATLTMCPSCCQRIGSSGAGVPVPIPIAAATPASNNPLSFTLGPGTGMGPGSKAHFYPSFSNPSAAC